MAIAGCITRSRDPLQGEQYNPLLQAGLTLTRPLTARHYQSAFEQEEEEEEASEF
jgi:hypothetical protein